MTLSIYLERLRSFICLLTEYVLIHSWYFQVWRFYSENIRQKYCPCPVHVFVYFGLGEGGRVLEIVQTCLVSAGDGDASR